MFGITKLITKTVMKVPDEMFLIQCFDIHSRKTKKKPYGDGCGQRYAKLSGPGGGINAKQTYCPYCNFDSGIMEGWISVGAE